MSIKLGGHFSMIIIEHKERCNQNDHTVQNNLSDSL